MDINDVILELLEMRQAEAALIQGKHSHRAIGAMHAAGCKRAVDLLSALPPELGIKPETLAAAAEPKHK